MIDFALAVAAVALGILAVGLLLGVGSWFTDWLRDRRRRPPRFLRGEDRSVYSPPPEDP